jgi:hypothetical protein
MAAALGRDPFASAARADLASLHAEVTRAPGGLRARLELRDGGGRLLGARELRGADCDELAAALTLAGAMAVDALDSLAPPAPAPPPHVEPTAVPQLDDAELPFSRVVRTPRPRPQWQITAAVMAALDATTLAAPGLALEVDAVRPQFSVGVEARGALPSPVARGQATVSPSLWTGAIIPCWRHRVGSLCGIVALGDERVSVVELGRPPQLSAFWAALGGRVAVELPFARTLLVRVYADVWAPLTPHELSASDGTRLYRTPPVSSSLGVALGARIP